jgi:hypothetical protein
MAQEPISKQTKEKEKEIAIAKDYHSINDELSLEEVLPEYEARLQDLEDNLIGYNQDYNPKKFNDETKSLIAQRFVKWYFVLLGSAVGAILIYNLLVALIIGSGDSGINLQDIILAISTAIGTPLGFIIGYYFKDSEQKSGQEER